jgi:phosphate:Na+ symporter
MMGTLVILDLMGGVALLLWGLHMVRTGILRAFGPDLRHLLSKAVGNRFTAFFAGLTLTAVLQSSTATGLMAASFASEGLVALVPALAIMLGANVGTTLIVQLFSFNIAAAAPVLFIIGLLAFRMGPRTRTKDLGRVAIGLGLMLLALHILLDTLAPAENAEGVRVLLNSITNDPVLCIMIAAALTWAAHSSVATVLLFMSVAYSHFVTPYAALALVLGANLGSAINPVLEAGRRDDLATYRLPVGNLLNRVVGILLVLPFLHPISDALGRLQPDASRMTAEFHIAFNVAMALVFIGLLDPLATLLERLFPKRRASSDPSAPRYLDERFLEAPSLALADAARETLRMGDAIEIISFAINLEHIGDIIDRNLCEVAAKKIKRKLQFSSDGADELTAFHKRVLESLKIAFGIFMSGDPTEARKLLADKAQVRGAELAAAERHLERLREGRPETLETTSLHLEILRDLKRIHSHICSAAYAVLDAAGETPVRESVTNGSVTSAIQ